MTDIMMASEPGRLTEDSRIEAAEIGILQRVPRRLWRTGRPFLGSVLMLVGCTAAPRSSAAGAGKSSPAPPHSVASGPVAAGPVASGPASSSPVASSPVATPSPSRVSAPVIVIDPGHAPTINHVDAATGLNDSDYENEPEMRDVFAVAELVRMELTAAGYRVVMTKKDVEDRVSLGQRAAIANAAHAALALSIHDQAGGNGGIGFEQGNNIVYYQAVGDYRQTPGGTRIEFTDRALAATSAKYGKEFQSARQAAQGVPVALQSDTGYDLGSRGLATGDIWIVQLLSKVPWIYNEAGGNSPGMSGLDAADQRRYAAGLVAAVQRCVPIK
jgi:N-acetylmuramoyl-L-alanine amidase